MLVWEVLFEFIELDYANRRFRWSAKIAKILFSACRVWALQQSKVACCLQYGQNKAYLCQLGFLILVKFLLNFAYAPGFSCLSFLKWNVLAFLSCSLQSRRMSNSPKTQQLWVRKKPQKLQYFLILGIFLKLTLVNTTKC